MYFQNICKIAKYLLATIAATVCVFVITIGVWLSKGIERSLPWPSSFTLASNVMMELENTKVRYLNGGNLQLTCSINIIDEGQQVGSVDKVIAHFNVLDIFKGIPIAIEASNIKLNLDNLSPMSLTNANINIFKPFRQILSRLRNEGFFHISSIKLTNAAIIKDQLSYDFNYKSDPNRAITLDIIRDDKHAILDIKHAPQALDIKVTAFPLHFVEKLLPDTYVPEFLHELSHTSYLNGNINFNLNKLTVDGEASAASHSQKIVLRASSTDTELNLEKAQITLKDGSSIALTGKVTHKDGLITCKGDSHYNLKAQDINLQSINVLWPKHLNEPLYKWLATSFNKGLIKEASVNVDMSGSRINHALSRLYFNGVTLKYADQFEELQDMKGEAEIDLNSVRIKVESGKLLGANIDGANVDILYNAKTKPIIINADTTGHIKDFTHFFGEYHMNELASQGVSIADASGELQGHLSLEIPLVKEVNLDNISLNVNGKIRNLAMKLSDKVNLSTGDLALKIADNVFALKGKGLVNGHSSQLDFSSPLQEGAEMDTQLGIESSIKAGEEFDTGIAGKIKVIEDEMVAKFAYRKKGSEEKLFGQINLEKAKFSIPDIGITQSQGTNSHLNIELIRPNKTSNWKSNGCVLTSRNLLVDSELELTKDFELIHLNSSIGSDKTDLKVNLTSTDKKLNIDVLGSSINLQNVNLLNLFDIKLFAAKAAKLPREMMCNVKVDKALMKNDVIFHDIIGNLRCKSGKCAKSKFSLQMGNNKQVKIDINETLNQWTFVAEDAARFLKALNLYTGLEKGVLSAQTRIIHNMPSSIFTGHISVENFYAIKNNIMWSLLLASPFNMVSAILKKDKLTSFKSLDFDFAFLPSESTLKIDNGFATGDLAHLTSAGHIKNGNINIKGIVTPKVHINEFTGAFSEGNESKGLIFAPYSITGTISEPVIRVNPITGLLQSAISVFPRLLKPLVPSAQ
jgi:hypothetical protein